MYLTKLLILYIDPSWGHEILLFKLGYQFINGIFIEVIFVRDTNKNFKKTKL